MKTFLSYKLLYQLFIVAFLCVQCLGQNPEKQSLAQKRKIMVETQIQGRGIKDSMVLDAMLKVERHLFVPSDLINYAYYDQPLPIGEDQTISQPYIVALMTEILELDSTKRILEIGTGSGYQAAILAEICKEVYSMEIISKLGERANKLLTDMGYSNINIKIGDGYQGWEEFAPFDAIIVTCSPTHIPEPLKKQLAEGGKMVIPYGTPYNQKLALLIKKGGDLIEKEIIPVRFVPMVKEDGLRY